MGVALLLYACCHGPDFNNNSLTNEENEDENNHKSKSMEPHARRSGLALRRRRMGGLL